MRRKGSEIKGVSNASFVDLKSVLYKREQDLKRHVPGNEFTTRLLTKRKSHPTDPILKVKRNKGLEERLQRDEEQHQTNHEISEEQRSAILETKARQYSETLRKGFVQYNLEYRGLLAIYKFVQVY
jgi:hypothetical protein